MSAFQPFDSQLVADVAFRSLVGSVSEVGGAVHSTRATGAELALLLGVEVEKDVTLKDTRLEGIGSGHTGLLVVGDKGLKRSVFESLVLKGGKGEGDADAVVRAEGGSLCGHPLPFNLGLDRVGEEIVLCLGGLLRNHVHVSLHDDSLAVLESRSGRNGEYDVAGVILSDIDSMLLSPVQKVLANLLLML